MTDGKGDTGNTHAVYKVDHRTHLLFLFLSHQTSPEAAGSEPSDPFLTWITQPPFSLSTATARQGDLTSPTDSSFALTRYQRSHTDTLCCRRWCNSPCPVHAAKKETKPILTAEHTTGRSCCVGRAGGVRADALLPCEPLRLEGASPSTTPISIKITVSIRTFLFTSISVSTCCPTCVFFVVCFFACLVGDCRQVRAGVLRFAAALNLSFSVFLTLHGRASCSGLEFPLAAHVAVDSRTAPRRHGRIHKFSQISTSLKSTRGSGSHWEVPLSRVSQQAPARVPFCGNVLIPCSLLGTNTLQSKK